MAILPSVAPDSLSVERTNSPSSATAPRFTRDGSDQLEQHLARACDQALVGIQTVIPGHKLEALMLGGGYGRGEGGVLKTETGNRPYNDLEFYVCVGGNRFISRWRYEGRVHGLSHILSPAAGVDVEFKIISLDYLRRSPVTMFYYDLLMGHRWLWGTEALLQGCEHHCQARNIPPSEATRLLMNRCSGLLFAGERLERKVFTKEDADFVGRNLAKAQLAFGDVLLASLGLYHWSCLERSERLQHLTDLDSLTWLHEVRRHHAVGVRFKLHPNRVQASPAVLRAQHEELRALGLSLWLWLENRRLGGSFQSARDYAMSAVNKCPAGKLWRNSLVNLKTFGPAAFFAKGAARDPRERLLHALAILLWEPWLVDSRLLGRLRNELQAPRASPADLPRIYQMLWAQFN